jgi:hypothetical protein
MHPEKIKSFHATSEDHPLLSLNKASKEIIVSNPFEHIMKKLASIEASNSEILRKLALLEKQNPEIGDIHLAEKVTGYARQTIYQLVSARKIPYFKKQGKLYFSTESLIAWLKKGRQYTFDEVVQEIKIGKIE